MFKNNKVLTILISFSTLVGQHLFAVEWKGACETNYPPFNYIEEDGKKVGMDTEIVTLVMKKMGIQFSIKNDSWENVIALLKNNEVDFAWQFISTEERKKLFYLAGPFRDGFDVFMVKKESKVTNWRAFSDFKNQKIGVIKHYNYTHEFDQYKGFTKIEFIDVEELILGLITGKVDFIIGDYYSLAFVLRKYHYSNKIRFLPSSIKKSPRYIAFSRKDKFKYHSFEKALKEVMKTKEFKEIIKKYKSF